MSDEEFAKLIVDAHKSDKTIEDHCKTTTSVIRAIFNVLSKEGNQNTVVEFQLMEGLENVESEIKKLLEEKT